MAAPLPTSAPPPPGGPAPGGHAPGDPAAGRAAAPRGAPRNPPVMAAAPPPCASEGDAEHNADLLRQEATASERKLIEVYGDTIHWNNGHHLHGGVANNAAVCGLYDRLVSYSHPLYSPP